ncbi:SbmA/BacA-like family transporter [Bradyrhizobium sp. LHD-71]|uniref:ABC transporter ATP-binding protein/permease n=1 Tax=Bradyrhizobium sp. LHD-71 TaxID=3072141 RepID=UPI00280DB717|nr:SbmA/BacA-like family transporter [Bradyrhizobium sp. LHD-71]MDQ8729593.1 SbmA/BacA-like family transporter [Bradyrhizobium sp. LHD-71]
MRDILKQIWRFLRIAASGPGKWVSLLLLVFVIGCQYAAIQVTVRSIQWYADFYNALQKLDVPVITGQIGVFFALAGASAALYLVGRYARKVLQIRWRRRLTDTLVDGWLANKAYWLLSPPLVERAIDNPDQRIAEDCNLFCEFILGRDEGLRSGVLDFVMKLVGLYTYATLLWQLSTFTLSFNAFGIDVEIPKYMFWLAPVYVAIAVGLTHALGRPLSGRLAEEQKREADFRSALIHVRENAPAIALLRGEAAERHLLSGGFEQVARIWYQVIRREFIFGLFQRPYFQTVLRIPIFIALPGFLAGKVTLGGLMQLANSFQQVVTDLSWFVFNYKFLADLVATTRRMQRFLDAAQSVPADPANVVRPAPAGDELRVGNLTLRAPDNRVLLKINDLTIRRGQTVWLSGASGLGKSTLFKTLAGLWPYASGKLELPAGRLCFLPQQVYLPLVSLGAAAIYPALPDSLPRPEIEDLLRKVGLGHRLGAEADTAGGLSVGEQQRLALARVLAAKPDWVFLDEATSALDLDSERKLMTLLRTEMPDATFILVAHREPQGLSNVVRIELPEASVDTVTPAAEGIVQGNLALRMG